MESASIAAMLTFLLYYVIAGAVFFVAVYAIIGPFLLVAWLWRRLVSRRVASCSVRRFRPASR